MKVTNRLQIEQLDRKIEGLTGFSEMPTKGWISGIRTALKMSLRQLGERMSITAQSAQEIESRESTGNITLNNLREVAEALDMKLVYGFIPREGSLEKMLEKQAYEVARKIVLRTNHTMKLEDQAVGEKRIEKAIRDLAEEIKHEMPRYLWN